MNESESDVSNNSIADLTSDEVSLFYVHIILLDVLLLVMGVFGNALVLYIYQWRLQRTVFTLLVRALAVVDFLSVSVNIPLGILFKFVFIHPTDYRLCSVYIFVEHFVFCFSGLLFIIIAIQRYRKMCKVFKEQVQLPLARKLLVAALCFSCGVSIPLLLSISGRFVDVSYNHRVIRATTCDYSDKAKESRLALVGAILLILEFVFITIVLASLYLKISRKYNKHERQARNLSFRKSVATRHMTKIFCIITVFFLVSMTPVLICSSVFSVTRTTIHMNYVEFVLFDIGIIVPYFHSIINPIIYGVAIRNFRLECKKLLNFGRFSRRSDIGSNDEPNREGFLLREST